MAATAVLGLSLGCEPTNQGYQPSQPIVYSHAVHAGDLQIPCQYCHFGAERGRFAGIPPASVCMNCHRQVRQDHPEVVKVARAIETNQPIPWVRVNWFPDHATFDHSVHIAADIECQTCHGAVESMGRVRQEASLTMGWCLNCHRSLGKLPGTVGAPEPVAANRLTDCAVCHH